MTLIAVNNAQMQSAVSQVRSTWRTLENQFQELQGIVGQLSQAWQGDDQAAYHASQQKWNKAAQELNQGLSEIGGGVDNASQRFMNAKQANTRMWQ